jgi:hypothetical protein
MNHHLSPILLMDARKSLDLLYKCHVSGKARHLVPPVHPVGFSSDLPQDRPVGEPIAPFVSYNVWSDSHLQETTDGTAQAFFIAANDDSGHRGYGDGKLQLRACIDRGEHWTRTVDLNPRPMIPAHQESDGSARSACTGLTCCRWPGLRSVWEDQGSWTNGPKSRDRLGCSGTPRSG